MKHYVKDSRKVYEEEHNFDSYICPFGVMLRKDTIRLNLYRAKNTKLLNIASVPILIGDKQ